MFLMFVIVGKVINLLLLFVTCMIFLCSFRILLAFDEVMFEVINFDVRRSLLIIFLSLLNILVRNLFLLRYFCAVCLCYA